MVKTYRNVVATTSRYHHHTEMPGILPFIKMHQDDEHVELQVLSAQRCASEYVDVLQTCFTVDAPKMLHVSSISLAFRKVFHKILCIISENNNGYVIEAASHRN